MAKYTPIITLILIVAGFGHAIGQETANRATSPVAEIAFSSETIRPGNMAFTSDGRMFVTINPLTSPNVKVYEINRQGGHSKAYPNDEYVTGDNSVMKAVIGIRTDRADNLWLLDMGAKKFVVWDTHNEKLVTTIAIPEEVLTPTSFLQDFIIDEKHGRVIIADMTQGDLKSAPTPAFVVIDTKTGKAGRMAQSHPSLMPEMEGGFALNPIGIDPANNWVYYGALHGRTLYRVPAASFADEKELIANVKKYSTKSYCDGIAVDQSQNVCFTNIEEQALGVSNASGHKNIAMLPAGQTWPDGPAIFEGNLFCTVDQLNRAAALNNGKDDSKPPFLVIKTGIGKEERKSNIGFLVTLKAKPGKEKEAAEFVASAVELARQEVNTLRWYAFQIDESTFGVFDTFENETGRQEHLHGKIAAALFSDKAKELFEGEPSIQKTKMLSNK